MNAGSAGPPVTDRELNRWTLTRQHLVERARLDPVAAIEALAGMQAQSPPSPYIGLWSRIEGFERDDLHAALRADRVVKATVMRGTLHLVPAARLAAYRMAAGSAYFTSTMAQLRALGADLDAIRARVRGAVAERPHTRAEIGALIVAELPGEVPAWVHERPTGVTALSVSRDLVNVADDAAFGYRGGSRYRVAPPAPELEPDAALRSVVADYLRAYGPASRADLAQWSGNTTAAFSRALAELDLVTFTADDGRTLLDLADAPRPAPDGNVPVRFLPRWDNLLLAYAKRDRVLPEVLRRTVIAKNGDVAPTFLVSGVVAGTWTATARGPAVLELRELAPLRVRQRRSVEGEAERLLAWLRPDRRETEVAWG